jgi:hypothetical protein
LILTNVSIGFIVDEGQYNTITNPIPNFNRNPYLNKVVTKAQVLAGNPSRSSLDLRQSEVLTGAGNRFLL